MNSSFNTLAFAGIGMQELLVVLLIAILVFGAAKIPEIARSLGKAIREFKKATRDVSDSVESAGKDEPDKDSKGTTKP